jgi:hypothetical protein
MKGKTQRICSRGGKDQRVCDERKKQKMLTENAQLYLGEIEILLIREQ